MAAPNTTAGETEKKMAMDSESGIVIRPFNPAPDSWDEVAVSRICEITAPPNLRAILAPAPSAPLAPYLWALPYVRLEPGTCFVLDASASTGNADGDVTGTSSLVPASCVGYILCAPSTPSFVAAYEETYLLTLSPWWAAPPPPSLPWEGATLGGGMLQALHNPSSMLHSDFPELVEEYPAHLHIDILPAFQSKGLGAKMIERLETELRGRGCGVCIW
ncbi:hypothetical protein VC83_09176 [Pseudogymnoascus destructans]|uniref:N-acetyltransferase domain-containing protein n=1 Tax=Pseudogymnoascus destructans TaxID=655981 RepID=A0A176ZX29_9PEZI|nr:uncharacterized protein VC83_09176 [Pseudogymnoascus destructans]OAF54545.1 hypothetical protein VC83_09176 [Pseudogymnoascus destructans]